MQEARDDWNEVSSDEVRRDIAGTFSKLVLEYVEARDHALPPDEDVVAGLREMRAAYRVAEDAGRDQRGDAPRPLAERQRDWDITGLVPEQPNIDCLPRYRMTGCGPQWTAPPMHDYFVRAMYPVRLDQDCDRGEKLVQVMVGWLFGTGKSGRLEEHGPFLDQGAIDDLVTVADRLHRNEDPAAVCQEQRRTLAALLDRLKT